MRPGFDESRNASLPFLGFPRGNGCGPANAGRSEAALFLSNRGLHMPLQIIQAGEEVLRVQARKLSHEEILSETTRELIEHMKETMRDAPGVGLAAPQVGVSLQLAVIEDREEYLKDVAAEQLAERERKPVTFHAIINPEIIELPDATVEFFEGCLSLAGFS